MRENGNYTLCDFFLLKMGVLHLPYINPKVVRDPLHIKAPPSQNFPIQNFYSGCFRQGIHIVA